LSRSGRLKIAHLRTKAARLANAAALAFCAAAAFAHAPEAATSRSREKTITTSRGIDCARECPITIVVGIRDRTMPGLKDGRSREDIFDRRLSPARRTLL